jgi:hypothetical protein
MSYDEHGVAAGLAGAIHKAGSSLYLIIEDPLIKKESDFLKLVGVIADELGAAHLSKACFVMGAHQSTFSMSFSALAGFMDVAGYQADLLNTIKELEQESALAKSNLLEMHDIFREMAFEMTAHDHAQSAAAWIHSDA